jgi:SAM-dependent methyltransferase
MEVVFIFARSNESAGQEVGSQYRMISERDNYDDKHRVNDELGTQEESKDGPPTTLSRKDTLHLGIDPEGIFNKDPHTFMPDIWGWLCMRYGIRSVLDIGCGMGMNLAWFDEYGFEVLGVEGHPNAVAASLVPGRITQHDFTQGPWSPERNFDLCVCTEFAEHVSAEFEENWMVAVDKCKYLLLAAAPPGQRGYHHVNEQPNEYWVKRFESRGFVHDPEITSKLRNTCKRKPAPWARNTLTFFYRGGQSGHTLREQEMVQELQKVRFRNVALEGQLAAIYASDSWKLTAPLRWILELIRMKSK